MAECRSCGKEIPEGTLYCNECEERMRADESYLDSLLSSVVTNSAETVQERPAGKTTAEPVAPVFAIKEEVEPLEEVSTVTDEVELFEEATEEAGYSILGESDDSFLDDLFGENTVTEEIIAEDDLQDEILKDAAAYSAEVPEDFVTSVFDSYDEEPDAEATLLGEALAQEVFAESTGTEDEFMEPDFREEVFEDDDPFSMLGFAGEQQELATDVTEDSADDVLDFWNMMGTDEIETLEEDSADSMSGFSDLFGSADDFMDVPDIAVEEETTVTAEPAPAKKKSWWARIFGNIREDLSEEEIEERKRIALEKFEEDEQRAADEAAKAKLDKEEKAKRKEEEDAQKQAEKEALARKKADEKLLKAEKRKLAKDKKEQARRALLAEIEANEGKINKFGASIIIAMFAMILCFILLGTGYYNYKISIDKAQFDFDLQRYDDAYNDVYGLDIKEEDMELYDKIMTVQYVNVQLLSYMRYHSLDMDAEALDSLIKGLRRYETFSQQGVELGITEDLNYLKSQIMEQLNAVFGIDEATAYEMLALESQEDYSVQIYEIVSKKN